MTDLNTIPPPGWKDLLIRWADRNGSVRELWLFGSRGPKGGAKPESDVDLGLVLIPKEGFGNYVALQPIWRGELEAIVKRHVSLVPMIAGNAGDAVIRSTGVRLWQRKSPPA